METLVPLCGFSMIAGFVDAAVGGGGLIQLPAALILLPGVPVPTVLGTMGSFLIFAFVGIGTHAAIAIGSRFVRIFFLVVVCGLIARLTQTLLWP